MNRFKASALLSSLEKYNLEGPAKDFFDEIKKGRNEYIRRQSAPLVLKIDLEIFDDEMTVNGEDVCFSGKVEVQEGETCNNAFKRYINSLIFRSENKALIDSLLKEFNSSPDYLTTLLLQEGEAEIEHYAANAYISVEGYDWQPHITVSLFD